MARVLSQVCCYKVQSGIDDKTLDGIQTRTQRLSLYHTVKNKYIKDRKDTVGQIYKKGEAWFTGKGYAQNYTGHVTRRSVLAEDLTVNTSTDTMTSSFNLVDDHTGVKDKLEMYRLLSQVRTSVVISRYPMKKEDNC